MPSSRCLPLLPFLTDPYMAGGPRAHPAVTGRYVPFPTWQVDLELILPYQQVCMPQLVRNQYTAMSLVGIAAGYPLLTQARYTHTLRIRYAYVTHSIRIRYAYVTHAPCSLRRRFR